MASYFRRGSKHPLFVLLAGVYTCLMTFMNLKLISYFNEPEKIKNSSGIWKRSDII